MSTGWSWDCPVDSQKMSRVSLSWLFSMFSGAAVLLMFLMFLESSFQGDPRCWGKEELSITLGFFLAGCNMLQHAATYLKVPFPRTAKLPSLVLSLGPGPPGSLWTIFHFEKRNKPSAIHLALHMNLAWNRVPCLLSCFTDTFSWHVLFSRSPHRNDLDDHPVPPIQPHLVTPRRSVLPSSWRKTWWLHWAKHWNLEITWNNMKQHETTIDYS